ncbi:MAG: hypothetical protein JXR96_22115 [Deltaproteobacteria bacterium]|nr:hypothetical protein [Deltaproteobacteria bacterium]
MRMMFPVERIGLTVAWIASLALLGACGDGQRGPDGPVYPVTCNAPGGCYELPFRLIGAENADRTLFNRLPFPYDFFTRVDPESPSGLRLALDVPLGLDERPVNTPLIDEGLCLLDRESYTAAMNRLGGFSAYGTLLLETGEPVDDALFDSSGNLGQDAPVLLVDMEREERVAYRAEVLEACKPLAGQPEACEREYPYLAIRPLNPLQPGAHAVLVSVRLLDAEGRPPLMPVDFQEIWGVREVEDGRRGSALRAAERERQARLRACAERFVAPEDLVLAWDFSVQDARADLEFIAGAYLDENPPPRPDLDWDGDGQVNFYAPADYPAQLPPLPSADWSAVSQVAEGTLRVPEFRHATGEADKGPAYFAFERDAQGRPLEAGNNELHFFLFYPRSPVQPMPVVMFQHGIGSRKEHVRPLVGPLVERGLAVFVFDLPFHGSRETGYAPLDYIDVIYPSKAASSFEQSVAEQLFMLRALASGAFDLWPDGAGDGLPDFDPDRLGYLGHSLGSIVGATTVGLSADVDIAVFSAGGAGLTDYVDGYLSEYGLGELYPEYQLKQLMLIVQTFLDPGDPIHFIEPLRARCASGGLRYLFLQPMEDEVIPLCFSLNFSRLAGPVQVESVQLPIEGLDSAAAPYTGSAALFQYSGALHDFLFGGSSPGPEGRRQVSSYFESFFTQGTGEVIDPLEP